MNISWDHQQPNLQILTIERKNHNNRYFDRRQGQISMGVQSFWSHYQIQHACKHNPVSNLKCSTAVIRKVYCWISNQFLCWFPPTGMATPNSPTIDPEMILQVSFQSGHVPPCVCVRVCIYIYIHIYIYIYVRSYIRSSVGRQVGRQVCMGIHEELSASEIWVCQLQSYIFNIANPSVELEDPMFSQ